jgi:hypothetical protein
VQEEDLVHAIIYIYFKVKMADWHNSHLPITIGHTYHLFFVKRYIANINFGTISTIAQIFFLHYCTKNISLWSQITFQWHLVTYKNVIKMAAVQTSWFILKKNSLLASVLHYALLHYKNNGNILTTLLKDKISKNSLKSIVI